VEETLAELGLADRPRLTALNKVDRLDDPESPALPLWARGGIAVSAAGKWGLDELLAAIESALAEAAEERRFATAG
jgi:50S ribosomal subunit-associated GTPase HflX